MMSDDKAETEEELHADDDIARISGVGKCYSQRWKVLGCHTVRDLANIAAQTQTRDGRQALLDRLRKDRGSLTGRRLNQLLAKAQRVVARDSLEARLAAPVKSTSATPTPPPTAGTPEPQGKGVLVTQEILSFRMSPAFTTTTPPPPTATATPPPWTLDMTAAPAPTPQTWALLEEVDVDNMINYDSIFGE